jgi:hypothetical protein
MAAWAVVPPPVACDGDDGTDTDLFGVVAELLFDGAAVFAGDAEGCDDCAAAPCAVVRARTVGRITRVFRRNEKDLKLLAPRKYKSERTCSLKRLVLI